LTLEGVRAYRQLAAREEERVGYWQRVIVSRLDAVRGNGNDVDVEHLRPGLQSQQLGTGRTQVMAAGTADLPPMPDLDAVWVDVSDPHAETMLAAAADGITTYRAGLATQVQVATQELIARYRSAPTDCLTALPA
ncbi:MAG: hypothetical protein ACRDTP_05375, partial [Mycobacteriales bacterium]